jgi:L-alanine-DL-glutamate epimerase-like enolase superfamily enzyme
MRALEVRDERWPIAGRFVIARGAKTEASVVVVEICDGAAKGRGECVPYPRYGETTESVAAQIEGLRTEIESGCGRDRLQALLPPGAARNALDCALWDLEAKLSGEPAWRTAGRRSLDALTTAYTISLGEPAAMAAAASASASRPILKLKIGGAHDFERVKAVREAAPRSRLIVDANEALTFAELKTLAPELAALGVGLIEQPLAAGDDQELEGYESPVALCADESLHSRAELAACAARYRCVNIKLDKSGGLTEALLLERDARAAGLAIMVGCMVATSLAMAPAMVLAQGAALVDLDGPLLLAKDREPGLTYVGSVIEPAGPELWG